MVQDSLSVVRDDASSRIRRVQLGAPVNLFKPLQKTSARHALGIKADHFVIAFSVSSLTEARKGGHYLVEALRDLAVPNVSVLLIGNLDVPFEVTGVEIVPLGYVTETSTLTAAMSAADVYVGPSTEETFGQVFIEAALTGTPSIGFDQTGVRDAIVDGVTGFRVPPSVEALREALLRLYHDRALCQHLGWWAYIYARNEFSLESSYHSLFVAWQSLGMVDQWGIPHKIGFIRDSVFVGESLRGVSSWRAVHGVSAIEGPYPQFGLPATFQWCHGAHFRIAVNCPKEGNYKIRLHYYCNLFNSIEIKLEANEQLATSFTIKRTKPGKMAQVEFNIDAVVGANYLDFFPGRWNQPTIDEPRALVFMLQNVEVTVA